MNLSHQDAFHLHYITKRTKKYNKDNISRTKAYLDFYIAHPEIKWSFLASMVSRNAGYTMTDLLLPPFMDLLNEKERTRMFMTYERANWLIFSDAYPQLLIYELSLLNKRPMFHLLSQFCVSKFMIKEWNIFWKTNNEKRLVKTLIINEQNVIQAPVIKQAFFRRHVFTSIPYLLQDMLYMNAVLFPTITGDLYGTYVHDFSNITKRIKIGKQLSSILFTPKVHNQVYSFALKCEHTGSRRDYEQFTNYHLPVAPMLRTAYPFVRHQDNIRKDWYNWVGMKKKWLEDEKVIVKVVGQSFYSKRSLLYAYSYLKKAIKHT